MKGIIYGGDFENEKLKGIGFYINPNEYFYQGSFENNKKQGNGKIIYRNGEIYEGDWNNDIIEGSGKMVYSNGNIYIGNFRKNLIEGNGIFHFKNGKIINGNDKLTNKDWILLIGESESKKEIPKKIINLKENIIIIKKKKILKMKIPYKKCKVR